MKTFISICVTNNDNNFFQSHIDEHSDREDDLRDCESSDEGVNVNTNGRHAGMDFSSRSPNRVGDMIK